MKILNQTNNNQTKRFYWLKLKDNFFDREEIQLIESLPNGKEYVLILLKFMMKAINSDGRLVVKDLIPYNPQMLATVTHSNIDTVRSAIDIFIKFGLMSTLDDGTLYMNEVQALLGSETEFAAKKREYRQNLKTQPKQLPDKSKTKEDIVLDNVRQENREQISDNKENTPLPPNGENRVGAVWNQIAKNLEFAFSDEEQIAISHWAEYQSSTQKSITVLQIETNLQKLFKLKTDGYDICAMISDTISAGYKWLLKPTPIYLLQNTAGKAVTGNKQRSCCYNNPEYFVPENKSDKCELRNYLERCYMRELVDPRTKLPLTNEQKKLFKAHFDFAKSKRIGITDYIYQQEVLTGKCLLEQSINGIAVSLIDVAA